MLRIEVEFTNEEGTRTKVIVTQDRYEILADVIVNNNQTGQTYTPLEARALRYCLDSLDLPTIDS